MAKTNKPRSVARRCAFQALYQWQLTGGTAHEVLTDFLSDPEGPALDRAHFEALVDQAIADFPRWEALMAKWVTRPPGQLDPVEKGVLLVGLVELAECPEVPYRVVLNEMVEIAKLFGSAQSHAFINSVLDKAARVLRPVETVTAPARGKSG